MGSQDVVSQISIFENITSVWYLVPAAIEALLIIILVVYYYLAVWKKDFTPVAQQEGGTQLQQFFMVVSGVLGGFILVLIWGRLLEEDWPPLIVLTLEFLVLFDNWYGGFRRYSKLSYYLGHFILEIALLFVFLMMAYVTIVKTTLVVATIFLYALHGLLWDIYYARKVPSKSWGRFDLESSLHYASLLAMTFVGIQLYFGFARMFILDWQSVVYILVGLLVCRIFLFCHQKRRRAAFLKMSGGKQYSKVTKHD